MNLIKHIGNRLRGLCTVYTKRQLLTQSYRVVDVWKYHGVVFANKLVHSGGFSRELYYTGLCRIQSITFLELFGPVAKSRWHQGFPKILGQFRESCGIVGFFCRSKLVIYISVSNFWHSDRGEYKKGSCVVWYRLSHRRLWKHEFWRNDWNDLIYLSRIIRWFVLSEGTLCSIP